MDTSALIAALIGLISPIVISAIRRPASKIQERIERIQYWKAFYEVSSLAGRTVSDGTKALCFAELEESEDEIRNLTNRRVSFVTNVLAVSLMYLALLLIARVGGVVEHMMVQQFQHQTPPQVTQQEFRTFLEKLDIGFWVANSLVMCFLWFWIRWKIRDAVWKRVKPGGQFEFFLTVSDRWSKLLELVLLLVLLVVTYFAMLLVWQIPQDIFSVKP